MDAKRAAEEALREAFKARGGPKFAEAEAAFARWPRPSTCGGASASPIRCWSTVRPSIAKLFDIARHVLRFAEETAKPNPDRLREYRESNLESLKQEMYSPAPIYDDLETIRLADSLSRYMEQAGADDPLLVRVLDGKSPRDRAAELVRGTKLGDVALRKKLAEGGPGRSGFGRSDAGRGPAGRSGLARSPRKISAAGRRALPPGLRPDRAGPVRAVGQGDLSRRHVHAAAGLWRGSRLSARRRRFAPLDDDWRGFRACRGPRRHAAFRSAPKLGQSQGQARPVGSLQFRQHGGYHRGQFGQPGGQSGWPVRGDYFRRQPAIAGLGFRLYRSAGTGVVGPLQLDFGSAAPRFIMPIAWWPSCGRSRRKNSRGGRFFPPLAPGPIGRGAQAKGAANG